MYLWLVWWGKTRIQSNYHVSTDVFLILINSKLAGKFSSVLITLVIVHDYLPSNRCIPFLPVNMSVMAGKKKHSLSTRISFLTLHRHLSHSFQYLCFRACTVCIDFPSQYSFQDVFFVLVLYVLIAISIFLSRRVLLVLVLYALIARLNDHEMSMGYVCWLW